MKNNIVKLVCIYLAATAILTVRFMPVYAGPQANHSSSPVPITENIILISLIYPQESNAAKRPPARTEVASVLLGKVAVTVSGIAITQANSATMYVEYFLDSRLIYNNQNKKSLSFELDTANYADGEHTLTANLWDINGPSAIGIKKIIIKNIVEDEK